MILIIVSLLAATIIGTTAYYLSTERYRIVERNNGLFYLEKGTIEHWRIVNSYSNLASAQKGMQEHIDHDNSSKIKKVYKVK
jgi:hypothetical protein